MRRELDSSIVSLAYSVELENALKEGIRVMGGKVHGSYGKLFEAKWGELHSARGFFRWPGCCFDRPLRLLACEFCPMLSSFVKLGGMVLPSPAGSCLEHAS